MLLPYLEWGTGATMEAFGSGPDWAHGHFEPMAHLAPGPVQAQVSLGPRRICFGFLLDNDRRKGEQITIDSEGYVKEGARKWEETKK